MDILSPTPLGGVRPSGDGKLLKSEILYHCRTYSDISTMITANGAILMYDGHNVVHILLNCFQNTLEKMHFTQIAD